VAALTALGVACAAPGLRAGLWIDEASMASVAVRPFSGARTLLDHADAGIGGYVLGLNRWAAAAGASEVALRLPSLLAGAVTVVAAAVLARRIGGAAAAVTAAALLALHPLLLPYYAVEARPYALSTMFLTLAALAAHAGRRATGPRGWLLALAWAVAASAAVACHAMGVLAVGPAALWLLPGRPRSRLLLAALPAVTGVVMVAGALRFGEQQEWLPELTPAALLDDAVGVWSPAALLAGTLALLVGLRRRNRPADRLDVTVLASWAVGPIAALAVLSVLREPALLPRYVLSCAVPAAILAGRAVALAVERRPDHLARRVVPAAAAVLALALLTGGLRPAPKPDDLRAAADYIDAHRRPGDAVLYTPGWVEMGGRWYVDEPDLAAGSMTAAEAGGYWTPPTDRHEVLARLAGVARVWVVGYPDSPPQAPEVQADVAAALRACWLRDGDERWFGVGVQLYRRPPGPQGVTCPAAHLSSPS
jgi:mannosyltransferase